MEYIVSTIDPGFKWIRNEPKNCSKTLQVSNITLTIFCHKFRAFCSSGCRNREIWHRQCALFIFLFIVPCIIIFYWNNQQMQLYAVNFIPLLSSLYMFRAAHTPNIRSTTVSTATGTIIGWRRLSRLLVPEGARHWLRQLVISVLISVIIYMSDSLILYSLFRAS